jgi:hypothetical protein
MSHHRTCRGFKKALSTDLVFPTDQVSLDLPGKQPQFAKNHHVLAG